MQNSIVNIPVSLNLDDVERVLNKQMKGLLYEDNDMTNNDNDQLMVLIRKDGDIRLSLEGQEISYAVPLAVWIKKGVMLGTVEAEGNLFLYFRSKFEIKQDWSLETQTELERFEWRRKPKVKVGRLNVSVQFVANRVLKRHKLSLGKAIDQQISKKLELRKYVLEAWNKLQEPVLISEEYGMWLKLVPAQITMTSLVARHLQIISTVSINTETDVIFGDKPLVEDLIPLPPFSETTDPSKDFLLNVEVNIPFAEAEKIAKEFVVGESFSNSGQEIKVEDIHLSGKEDRLMIETKVSGAYDGSIVLMGKPLYNSGSKTIEMEELDFELETDSFIMKSIGWLFKKGLKRKIEEGLKFPVGEKIEAIKRLVSSKIDNFELAPHIILKGNIQTVNIGQCYLKDGALGVWIHSHGKVNVHVDGLEI